MEERKYGNVTVRVTYGKENLTDLLIEYVRGISKMRNYGDVIGPGGYYDGEDDQDISDGNVCETVKGGSGQGWRGEIGEQQCHESEDAD